jgi:LmbE family N-acetylglucosaminyl deacetylase
MIARAFRAAARCALAIACLSMFSIVASGAPGAFEGLNGQDRLLIVAPHPDDESLCCAGIMQQALRSGASVAVVWLTSGDGFEVDAMVVERSLRPRAKGLESLARMRMEEARRAMTVLGVPPQKQYFLGYPDRGIVHLLSDHESVPYRSRYTSASAVPYSDALSPGAPYTGQSLMKDFLAVLDREQRTLVLAASAADTHPDHHGSGELARRAMEARGQMERLRYWIVHGGEGWPYPLGLHPQLPQTAPPRGENMLWSVFNVTAGDLAVKESAILQYRSQFRVMARKLQGYVRKTELFSEEFAGR